MNFPLKISFLVGLCLMFALLQAPPAMAQLPNTAFFRHRVAQLGFSTSPQTLLASLCSGVVTVQTRNSSSVATNVAADLTIALAGSAGLTFYSDSACTNSISSVTVTSGNSSANFYFMGTVVSAASVTASATGYASANQGETISTNKFIWTGNGGNSSWSTAGNWSGGAAPSSGNVAVFDGSCVSNCSADITSNVDVGGVRLNSGYSGTITQNSGFSLTVRAPGWVQTSGNFVGSSGGDAILINNTFILIAGSFKATSGNFSVKAAGPYDAVQYKISGSANLLANSGTLTIDGGCVTNPLTFGSVNYNHLTLLASVGCPGYSISDSNVTISGNLTLGSPPYGGGLNGGTLSVGGNVSSTGPDPWSGSAVIKLTGNPSGQTITAPSSGSFPHLTIAAGSNPVTLSGTVTVLGNYIATSASSLTTTGSTLYLNGGCSTQTVTPGNFTYNNVKLSSACVAFDFGNGTMNINGDLTLTNPSYGGSINSGTLAVAGNVTTTGPTQWDGSAIVKLVGRVSGQTITATGPGYIPNLTIDAGANPVTVSGSLGTRNYILTSVSSLITTGSTIRMMGPTVTVGTENYNNVTMGGACSQITLTGTVNVLGDLILNDACNGWLFGGSISVKGNTTLTAWYGGSTMLTFNGSSQQTIAQASNGGYAFPGGAITLNNPYGLLLSSNVSLLSGTHSLNVSNGDISMAGYSLSLTALNLNSHSVTRSGGTLTVGGTPVPGGTQSLYGGTINP